jgi:hypothetical protein
LELLVILRPPGAPLSQDDFHMADADLETRMATGAPAVVDGVSREPASSAIPLLQILFSREKYRENSANEGTGGVYTPPEILASTAGSRNSRWIDLRLNSEILAP